MRLSVYTSIIYNVIKLVSSKPCSKTNVLFDLVSTCRIKFYKNFNIFSGHSKILVQKYFVGTSPTFSPVLNEMQDMYNPNISVNEYYIDYQLKGFLYCVNSPIDKVCLKLKI